MRRTLAGLLFGLAYACAGLTIAGFLLQRTAFDPARSAAAADVVLQDEAIKNELVTLISDAVATQLGPLSPNDPNLTQSAVHARVEQVASTQQGAELLAEIIHDSHARLIGEQTEPVIITPQQLVDATQMEAAAALPALTLDVPKVTTLDVTRQALTWIVPIAAIATLALVAMGLFAHPEKGALFKSLGLGLLLLALMVAIFGYVVPKWVIPALSDSPWAGLPAALADDSAALLLGLELLLVGGALALLAGTGVMRRRQRWSTPVNTYRYQEERRWS